MHFHGSFGNWLKQQRKALDLTQRKLALEIGCAEITIRKIEADKLKPSKQIAELLAELFAIAAEDRDKFLRFARSIDIGTPRSKLPAQPTSLIGREAEIGEIVGFWGDAG